MRGQTVQQKKPVESEFLDTPYPQKINGTEFNFSKLNDRDFSDLDGYIQSKFIELTYQSAEKLSPEARDEVIDVALTKLVQIGWGTREGFYLILTKEDGLLHLGYQLARRRHKALTFEEFEKKARGNSDEDLAKSLKIINAAYRHFYPPEQKVDGQGGSSTENKKSSEQEIPDEGGDLSEDNAELSGDDDRTDNGNASIPADGSI